MSRQSQYKHYRQVQSAHRASRGPNRRWRLLTKEDLLWLGWFQRNRPGRGRAGIVGIVWKYLEQQTTGRIQNRHEDKHHNPNLDLEYK